MFKNSHGFLTKKKSEKKRLIICTGNLSSQQKSDQSLSFFVNVFWPDIPKFFVKLLFQRFLNNTTLRIV